MAEETSQITVDDIYVSMTNDALEDIASGICPAATTAELLVLWAHFRNTGRCMAVYGRPNLPLVDMTPRELDLFTSFEGVFSQFILGPAIALTISSPSGGLYIRRTNDAGTPFVTADLPPATIAWDTALDGPPVNYIYGEYVMLI